jgi:mono/diheme cytochrome c family protein
MANSQRLFGQDAADRPVSASRSVASGCACAIALLVAACAQSPNRADGGAPATSALLAPATAERAPATPAGGAASAAAAASSGAVAFSGEQTYRETCVACHGEDGKGGQGGGMPLTAVPNVDFVVETVSYGRNNMPSFAGVLTTEQIRAVSDYVLALGKQ